MNPLKIASYLGLALTFFPCIFLAAGAIEPNVSKGVMTVGMLLWFGTAVFWIKPTSFEDE